MKIVEAQNLPEGEEVYLKKDWTGWRVVEPIVHPTTRKFMWKNFLSKKGFLFLIIILVLSGIFYLGVNELLESYKQIAQDPCSFCSNCHEQCRAVISKMQPVTTISKVNITGINFIE